MQHRYIVEKVAKLLGRLFGVPVVSMISARPVEAIMFLVACLFVCLFVCNITGERVQLSSYTFRKMGDEWFWDYSGPNWAKIHNTEPNNLIILCERRTRFAATGSTCITARGAAVVKR